MIESEYKKCLVFSHGPEWKYMECKSSIQHHFIHKFNISSFITSEEYDINSSTYGKHMVDLISLRQQCHMTKLIQQS